MNKLMENDLTEFLDGYEIEVNEVDFAYLIDLMDKGRLVIENNRCIFKLKKPIMVGDNDQNPLTEIDMTPKTFGEMMAVENISDVLKRLSKLFNVKENYLSRMNAPTMKKVISIFEIFFRD